MSGIGKKLQTGTLIRTWNFDESNCQGQTIAVKNNNGDYQPVIHVESVNCAQGTIDRVEFKKEELENLGFTVIVKDRPKKKMSSKQLAYELHSMSKTEFAEVFAYLDLMHKGELEKDAISQKAFEGLTLTADGMRHLGKDLYRLTHWIGNSLSDIINDPKVEPSAWWKHEDDDDDDAGVS